LDCGDKAFGVSPLFSNAWNFFGHFFSMLGNVEEASSLWPAAGPGYNAREGFHPRDSKHWKLWSKLFRTLENSGFRLLYRPNGFTLIKF